MRFKLKEELDVYDIFTKYGFGDGDHPLAPEVKSRVYDLLEDLGWQYKDAMSVHNNGYIVELLGPNGERHGSDFSEYLEGALIREEMIRRGYPKSLLDALDDLNGEAVTYLPP